MTTSRYTPSTIGPYDLTWIDTNVTVKCHEWETLQGTFWRGEQMTNSDKFVYFMTKDATPARASFNGNAWLIIHI